MSVLSVVTLKSHFAGATGAQADSLRVTGDALVTIRQWTFLLGPGLIAGINALFLGYVMYRGRLVPRIIPTIGLIGAPLILTSAIVTIFGGWAQTSGTAFVFGVLDRHLGVLARRLPDLQGLQAGPGHHRLNPLTKERAGGPPTRWPSSPFVTRPRAGDAAPAADRRGSHLRRGPRRHARQPP